MSDRFELVPFDGRQLMTVSNSDGIFIVMKPVVEALGLAWEAQRQRIHRHPVIAKGACITQVPSAGGMQEAVTLQLDAFHGWLLSLNPLNIRDDQRRETIIRYQERAFRVVFEHFHGRIGTAPRAPVRAAQATIALQNQYLKLLDRLVATTDRGQRQATYALAEDLASQMGVAVPPLAALGRDAPPVPAALDRFWESVDRLETMGIDVNHSINPQLLALNMPSLFAALANAGIRFTFNMELRAALKRCRSPRFVDVKTVKSRVTRAAMTCWVFERR